MQAYVILDMLFDAEIDLVVAYLSGSSLHFYTEHSVVNCTASRCCRDLHMHAVGDIGEGGHQVLRLLSYPLLLLRRWSLVLNGWVTFQVPQ